MFLSLKSIISDLNRLDGVDTSLALDGGRFSFSKE